MTNPKAKIWWRVVAAILAAAVIAVNGVFVVLFLTTSKGGFTRVPAHYVVTLELAQPRGPGGSAATAPASLPSRDVFWTPMEDVIRILKQRVDPGGIYCLQWRALSEDRIEVSMPAGTPADLMRCLRKEGVLEFRMAPWDLSASMASAYGLTPDEADSYKQKLEREGPDQGHKRNDPYQWFPLRDPGDKLIGLITAQRDGRQYVLLSNLPQDTLLRSTPERPWRLTYAYPTTDGMGKPAVGFNFDARGGAIFSKLTTAHKSEGGKSGDQMAVLVDGEVYSAPTIRSTISGSGIIQGKFTQREVNDLVRPFRAASPMDASVKPDPVSIREVPESPAPGGAMRLVGLIALAAVAVLGLALALIWAIMGRVGRYILFGLLSTAAAAAFWIITAQADFTGPAPKTAFWINAGLAAMTLLASVVGLTRWAFRSPPMPPPLPSDATGTNS